MAQHTFETHAPSQIATSDERLSHVAWYAFGAVGGFLVPFIFSSLLELQHDLYYLIYFVLVGAFLGAYVARHEIDLAGFFRNGIWLSVAIGVPVAAFLVFNVLSRDSTDRPDGAYFAFEVAWRGLAYGVVDALLLSAFPALVAFGLLGGVLKGFQQRLAFAGLVLALTLIITGTYHLGYEQFREDGISQPELGNSVISLPVMASGNPVGSIIAHSSMHVAAVSHSYETDVFLPPQVDAD